MANALDQAMIEHALSLLAEKLEADQSGPLALVVCGGASLVALGLVSRATRDVDVLALRHEQGKLVAASPLPEALSRAVEEIAGQLDLYPQWLNGEPTGLLEWGLPEGLGERLVRREYGRALTVWFVGRWDQIHFKLFAAADTGPGRHLNDLLALRPTEAELLAAARWALTQDASEGFAWVLKDMLRQMGHEHLAGQL